MSENLSNINYDEEEICSSQPISLPSSKDSTPEKIPQETVRPPKYKGQKGSFRSIEEIDAKYRHVFTYPYFNLVQSSVIDDALYSNKSMVVCAPTGSGKTVIFEMAILQLLMEREDKNKTDDFKIIYMAPVKALCTERITEWYSKFTKLGLLCIEVTGDTDVDFPQLKPYRIIITTPEKWDMLTRRWMEHNLVKVVKLFLIDEVHILNDESRGPVLEAVVSRMKTVESSARSSARLVAVSATISNPQDVSSWLGAGGAPAVHYKFGDECRPVTLTRVVEGYPCSRGTSTFKFDIILNYKLWPIIQKYYNGKPTLIFCNTRKSVMLTAETLSREVTVGFSPEQRGKLTALASTIKNKKIQSLVLSGVGCHHAGLLLEERAHIELAFRNRDLPILVTTTTLAMGVNLPAHLVIVKNTQQYVNGAYQEYSISTVLQMVGRAGRPQYDLTATAVIMTRLQDKARYQSLVDGSEPLQSFLHKRLAENINSEIALGTIGDVAQCVQWLNSTFLKVRAARDPKRYLGLPQSAPAHLITKKIEELCVKAMNGLESSGLVTMDELSCIESTEAGRLMSLHYLDLETMKLIMKIEGSETLDRLLWLVCESHELSDMHLRVDERRCLNALNRNNSAPTIRYPMKGKINSRQMKLNCIIQSVLGCLPIPDPSLNQEALKIMRTADRVCKCLVSYVTRPNLISQNPKFYTAIVNSLTLAKCITAHLWENSVYVSRQLKGIGPTFSTLLASAGKTNFMLLDESHPRDLERIMNKSPPAGNVLRKQISLLPKYNVTITPINEQSIRVQLSLLNQSYLAENIDSLTAGARHKSYIVVGDSENFLLYFSSFNDSDLINIYDGSMNFDVNRKHLNEHKVIAHCVSSSFVGIDNQCEYVFKDINPFPLCIEKTSLHQTTPKISPNRQTYITDIFKERKRKNNGSESTPFKEKKKRDGILIDKFKTLNKTFEKTSKDIKEKCNETKVPIIRNLVNKQSEKTPKVVESNVAEVNYEIDENDFLDDFEYEDVDNERINKLLNEIEGEVNNPSTSKCNSIDFRVPCKNDYNKNNSKTFNRDKVNMNKKNNYTFIEKLEKKNSEYDSDNLTNNKESGFCNTIKSNIQQYLEKAQNNIKSTIMDVIDLQEKGIDTKNLITSLENKEIVHYNIVNPENIDLTKIIEEDQNIITKMNISKENVEIIDLTSISPGTTNNNKIKSPDKSKTSPKTRKTLLENIEFDVTHIEKEEHALKTNADKILCNIEDKDNLHDEYFLKPNVPQILNSKPIHNHQPITPKPKTSTNSYNIKPLTSSSTSENLKQSGTFPADCALKRFEKHPEESTENTKELETYQKPLNVYSSLVEEKFEDLNESCLLSIHSEHNNSQLNTQNLNTGTKFRDIKKYSFNSTKTIGFRKENISKICTLKVALDVTESVHNEDNFDPQNDDFNKNSQNINEQNILSHMDKKGTVLQIEDNIRKSLTTSNNEKTLLNQVLEITKPPSEISDKSTINAKLKNKKTTLIRDILNRYKRNTTKQNNTKLEKTVLETCKTQEDKNIKKPEFKQKRKYRISDIDTIDITLPESLIPSQSQVINKTPNYINDKIQYQSKSIIDEEPKPSTVIENTDALFVGITSCNDIDEEVENKYDEELKINLNSYLDEPVIFSNLDLNTDVLDPKTLLQSLNNDEIIPPPPEFCDDYIYSPVSSLDLDTSKAIDLSSGDLHNANTLPNDNIIFEKTFVDLLQSSKKTDTWVLSRKDSDCSMSNHNSSFNTRVYRNHDESNESGFLKSKLSQYRFKRRNTLMK